jgi:hypothetical protein
MNAPESKWVAEAMDLVTLVVVAKQRDGVLRQSKLFPEARDKLEFHLQRQADLMERMGEALKFYGSSCDATESSPCGYEGNLCCKTARAALTAFQESKQ